MNQRTQDEVVKFVKELFQEEYWHEPANDMAPLIVVVTPEEVVIETRAMYEYVSLEFKHLRALADFFGTNNIADSDRSSYSGCETCDYGSCYEWRLSIKPEAPSAGK